MTDVNFTQSMIRIINNAVDNAADNSTLITLLSLSCLFSILNKNQTELPVQSNLTNSTTSAATNTLQRVLGELTKGDGSPSPDILMSLLPLLNSPQVKSKINPSNIGTLLGLLNGLGNDKNDKHKSTKVQNLTEQKETPEEPNMPQPVDSIEHQLEIVEPDRHEPEKKTTTHLNWKSNF